MRLIGLHTPPSDFYDIGRRVKRENPHCFLKWMPEAGLYCIMAKAGYHRFKKDTPIVWCVDEKNGYRRPDARDLYELKRKLHGDHYDMKIAWQEATAQSLAQFGKKDRDETERIHDASHLAAWVARPKIISPGIPGR